MPISDRYRPHYTYEDYCQWEGKWELIEGMPYAMSPGPFPDHRRVIVLVMTNFVKSRKEFKNYRLYPSIDWKIEEDTVVQPDLLIVCQKIEKDFLDFPPILIVEILSPSTASKDRGEKMELYLSQQVQYYLIIDPQFKKVEIYQYTAGKYELAAVTPDSYLFNFEESNCAANINFLGIWD